MDKREMEYLGAIPLWKEKRESGLPDEDELQRKVFDLGFWKDFGLQETLKLIFPTGQ